MANAEANAESTRAVRTSQPGEESWLDTSHAGEQSEGGGGGEAVDEVGAEVFEQGRGVVFPDGFIEAGDGE